MGSITKIKRLERYDYSLHTLSLPGCFSGSKTYFIDPSDSSLNYALERTRPARVCKATDPDIQALSTKMTGMETKMTGVETKMTGMETKMDQCLEHRRLARNVQPDILAEPNIGQDIVSEA